MTKPATHRPEQFTGQSAGLFAARRTVKPGLIAASLAAAVAAAALFTASALAAISSNVYIEADKAFLLGGTQPEAFTVRGRNTGPVPIQILARDKSARERGAGQEGDLVIATIAPDAKFKQAFARREVAVLRNLSATQTASVKVRVTGFTKGLGMRYEEAE